MVMDHEPVAIDFPKARRPSNPDTPALPILHGAAQPIDAVPERHAIAHGDLEVANLIAERRLEHRECLPPVFLFASAPVCRKTGPTSYDTRLGAQIDVTLSRSMARIASTNSLTPRRNI